MTTEAQKRAIKKYNQEKLDHVHLRLPKGKKDIIAEHIKHTDDDSLNSFILRAIDQQIERDHI